jgi:hypothetical protein
MANAAAAILAAVSDALAQRNTVLTQCGITTVAEQTNLINNEGFALIEDIGIMKDDKDVYEMAKQLAQHMVMGM